MDSLLTLPSRIVTSQALRDTVREIGFVQTTYLYLVVALVSVLFIFVISHMVSLRKVVGLPASIKEMTSQVAQNTQAVIGLTSTIERKLVDKELDKNQTDILYRLATRSHRMDKLQASRPVLMDWLCKRISKKDATERISASFKRITSQEKNDLNSFSTCYGELGDEFCNRISWDAFIEEYMSCWRRPYERESVEETLSAVEEANDDVMKNFIASIRADFKTKTWSFDAES